MPAWLFSRSFRVALALVLVLLGFDSVVSTAAAWLSGARPMISTGAALPVAGVALLFAGRGALGLATWALRIQFVVSIVATALVVAAAWPGSAAMNLVPAWRPVSAGLLHVAVAAGGLQWIEGFRRRNGLGEGGR